MTFTLWPKGTRSSADSVSSRSAMRPSNSKISPPTFKGRKTWRTWGLLRELRIKKAAWDGAQAKPPAARRLCHHAGAADGDPDADRDDDRRSQYPQPGAARARRGNGVARQPVQTRHQDVLPQDRQIP